MSKRRYKQDPQRKDRPKRYDTDMIRDFLKHLKAELIGSHLDDTKPGVIHPEVSEDIGAFCRRYQTPLRSMHALERPDGMTEAECQVVLKDRYHQYFGQKAATELKHLEALELAFNEALGCAIHSAEQGKHTETVFTIDPRKILDGSYFGEGGRPEE